jgi:hypothetical protein
VRTLAVAFGVVVLAGLVAMAVAGAPGAVALLATFAGIFVMIVLGVRLGGRGSGRRDPVPMAPSEALAAASAGGTGAPAAGAHGGDAPGAGAAGADAPAADVPGGGVPAADAPAADVSTPAEDGEPAASGDRGPASEQR